MPAEKLNVAVLMGGRATEHEVSLKTGTVVVNALNRSKYHILPVQICRDGRWLLPPGPLVGSERWLSQDEAKPALASLPPPRPAEDRTASGSSLAPVREVYSIPTGEILRRGIDVVFIALHGRYGEDGCIQGLLEVLGIPYTGSNVLASALAMDKVRSKQIASYHGILTPKWIVVAEHEWKAGRQAVLRGVAEDFGYPCVAKVPEEGSSFGMGIPNGPEELAELMDRSIGERGHMMIEQYIQGTEITCAVLGALPGETPTALPLTEIIPKASRYFDFEAKYTPGASEEITPARLDADLTHRAQEIGVRAHDALGCGGMSRTDMIVRGRDIYYLETNTIPGMTETSLYPQAARAAGLSFSEVLDRQIELALSPYERKR